MASPQGLVNLIPMAITDYSRLDKAIPITECNNISFQLSLLLKAVLQLSMRNYCQTRPHYGQNEGQPD